MVAFTNMSSVEYFLSLIHIWFQVVSYVFPHGEHSKSLEVLGALLNFCVESGLTRADFMVALGGGVVGESTIASSVVGI